jgi:drug/metabolite transporter superfamily protein YnfA
MDGQNKTAYRMTGKSSKELALLIIAVLDNPAAARVVAARGQEYVRESLTWATAVEKTIAVYDEAFLAGQEDSLWHHLSNVTHA